MSAEEKVSRLERRLERERKARVEAEIIAERGLREIFLRQQELKLLQRIAVAANESTSVPEAFALALEVIAGFAGWSVGHVYVARGETLSPTDIWYAVDGLEIGPFKAATATLTLPRGVGLPGRVMATGSPIWLEDAAQDPTFPRRAAALETGLHAAAAFPVAVGGEVAAVLEFFAPVALPPDAGLLDIMGQVGLQLGRVIERQRAQERLIHDASHDALTGLANRTLFQDRLAQAVQRRRRNAGGDFAVLFIDLDRFKLVNDSLGHLAGDTVIVEMAHRIAAALTADTPSLLAGDVPPAFGSETVARLGGDEFTVLVEDIRDPAEAIRIAERIQASVSQPLTVEGQEIYGSASIGLAYGGTGSLSATEVLRDADLAMYRAKSAGRGCVEIFDKSMHAKAVGRLKLESDLRRALREEHFMLEYQPIVALPSGRVAGFEALVRWNRGPGDRVPPADFIPLAEETGLIVFIGDWVLREACRTLRIWQIATGGDEPLTMSVNVSPRQFAQPDFVRKVRAAVDEAGVRPGDIRLEITESVTIENADRAIDIIGELNAFGVRVGMDDFGTGYSSLSYLQRLPLDVLKIDRSFISDMDSDAGSRQIVETIMSLARNLGIQVVAEGAEKAKHIFDLQQMGCHYGQGYFFSRPVGAESALAMLREQQSGGRREVLLAG